jgi:hypothetical protein
MIERICWTILALIHAMPAFAAFRPALISRLYGVDPGADVFTLLHHRAALFLAVVVICVWAAFRPEVRQLASIAVGISMVSFVLIWWLSGMPPALRTIAVADLIGVPFLLYAAWHAFRSGA